MAPEPPAMGGFPGHACGCLTLPEWETVCSVWRTAPAYLRYLAGVHGGGEHERSCPKCRQRLGVSAPRQPAR